MKVRYDEEDDILVIKTSEDPIDYAEKVGPLIIHFTKEGKAVLFEIMDATDFLTNIAPSQLREAREYLAKKA